MLPTIRTRTSFPSLVEEFFSGDLFPKFFDLENKYSIPAANIIEGKEDFRIEIAAPGLAKEDFKIHLDNNIITISSEKEENKEEKDKKNEKVMRKEFSYYSFRRSFSLPDTADVDKIKANHTNGVLQIVIPKREEAKQKPTKEIKIL